MRNKGQIKDKTKFQTKRKLSNGYFKPFESNCCGDPSATKYEIFISPFIFAVVMARAGKRHI